VVSRAEPQLSTYWGYGAPANVNGGSGTNLLARVLALLLIPTSGTFNFFLSADDSIRLFVDGVLVLNGSCCSKMESVTLPLQAGYTRVMYQHVNLGGPGYAQVFWDGGVVGSLGRGRTAVAGCEDPVAATTCLSCFPSTPPPLPAIHAEAAPASVQRLNTAACSGCQTAHPPAPHAHVQAACCRRAPSRC
jgi:hypothetical protein